MNSRQSSYFARFGVNTLVLLLALSIGLVLAELATRLLVSNWRDIWPQRFLLYDQTLGGLSGVPGYSGRLTNLKNEFDVLVSLDEQGFRNRERPERPRVVALGDSFGFGWAVQEDEIFSKRAAQMEGLSYLNLCLPAMDVTDYLAVARRHQSLISGAVLVLSVTIENDVLAYHPSMSDRPVPPAVPARVLRWLVHHSALVSLSAEVGYRSTLLTGLARRLGLFTSSGGGGAAGDPVGATLSLLDKLKSESGAGRAVAVIVPPRSQFGKDDQWFAISDGMRRMGWTVVDPGRAEGDFFPYDGHWTPATHSRVAALLAKELK